MKTLIDIDRFCCSSYLAFRYVARSEYGWLPGVKPQFPHASEQGSMGVRTSTQILDALKGLMSHACAGARTGILLSSGIDSAILAALMPAGSQAYTIRFVAEGAVDESAHAAEYARRCNLDHHIIDVTWSDYLDTMDTLMYHKKAPLHAVEVGLFKAASQAARDGISTLVIGNGADSTFGGLDKLLSRDWSFDEFVHRYTFVDPSAVLVKPVDCTPIYEDYRLGEGIDILGFLKVVHGLGVVQAFDNAIGCAGCSTAEPFESLYLDAPLDIDRIRRGESKYLLRSVFETLYPGMEIPAKIPFARPMDVWLKDWHGPLRPEFSGYLKMSDFTGDQKWLIYCLEHFMNLIDRRFD